MVEASEYFAPEKISAKCRPPMKKTAGISTLPPRATVRLETESGTQVLWTGAGGESEVRLPLPGAAGAPGAIVFEVESGAVVWQAPRVLARASSDPLAPPPAPPEVPAALRERLRGLDVLLVVLDAARARQFGCYGYARPKQYCDFDGQGTLLTTSDCLLGTVYPRNPGLDRAAIERVLGDYLVVDKVIWLPAGVAGDDTSGHVDDLARFVAPARVLLGRESNSKDENYLPLERAREMLQGERDAKGRRIEVIALPMPSARYQARERLPASYANFLIANGLVLVPTFNDPKDRQALGLLSELFPDREVVGIHCLDLVWGLGSIHCSTHQEPSISD